MRTIKPTPPDADLFPVRVGRATTVFSVLACVMLAPSAALAFANHPGPRQHCSDANVPATAASAVAMRSAVECLINIERTRRHLPPLGDSALLTRAAQGWTDQMVATGNFGHGPGNAFAQRISATGYDWQTVGENIATGYATPRSVVRAWMASTEHCRTILDPAFRDVGTGVNPHPVRGAAGGPATWTEDFGLLANASPPSGNLRPMNGCPYR